MINPSDTENFLDADSPRFVVDHVRASPACRGEFKVVSWNIKFSREIETALAELEQVAELRDADIMLLQEMDEYGVETIAGTRGYNFVYFPASVHCRTGRNFGNAILAKWPIGDAGKLLLPHMSPRTGEIRIATRATVIVGGHELLTYSVHTETFALSSRQRQEQFRTLVEDIAQREQRYVLVGGDFNTLQAREVRRLEEKFARVNLERTSAGAGPTLKAGFMSFSFDHIFTRGMKTMVGGVWRETEASDHYPLWQRLAFVEEDFRSCD
jgi:endonuclease/exonuclease/phosphatase family metal-dependent hydrolase